MTHNAVMTHKSIEEAKSAKINDMDEDPLNRHDENEEGGEQKK